jgi:glutaredoxin-like protein NrdH
VDVIYFFQEVSPVSVILYSKPHCLECNVLKRFLKDYQISYEERNCTDHPEYLNDVKEMGFLGVPVTVVNGTPVQGLQPDKILELLGRKGEA